MRPPPLLITMAAMTGDHPLYRVVFVTGLFLAKYTHNGMERRKMAQSKPTIQRWWVSTTGEIIINC
jgi:hypothetical protein